MVFRRPRHSQLASFREALDDIPLQMVLLEPFAQPFPPKRKCTGHTKSHAKRQKTKKDLEAKEKEELYLAQKFSVAEIRKKAAHDEFVAKQEATQLAQAIHLSK